MCIATLFIRTPNWKQSKYSSTRECINNLSYNYTIEYYSSVKGNKPIHATTFMNLTDIMLSESNQTQKNTFMKVC